jgi:hypothetical protein
VNPITFVDIASTRVANLQTVLTTVLGAEQAVLLPILKALLILFIARQFFLVHFGHLDMMRLFNSVIRAAIICFLVHGTVNFNQYIATVVFTNLPQALTNLGVGSYVPTNAGQSSAAQFDAVSAAGDAIATQIGAKDEYLSPATWINDITGRLANFCFQTILDLIFGIWLLGLGLLAISLCLFPPFLCFEFFERTRGFVDTLIGKIVGFSAFGFACSIVLGIEMQGLTTMLAKINGMASSNVPAAVAMLIHAVGDSLLDLLLMAACPVAFGFGSGAVAGLAAPAAFAASRTLMLGAKAAAAGGRGAVGAAGAGARGAVRAGSAVFRS